MIILIHSSKSMRTILTHTTLRHPALINKAEELGSYLKTLPTRELEKSMHISNALAQKTRAIIEAWHSADTGQNRAIDSFIGDIYSGLRASELSHVDRDYADQTLWILSGLYGFLRPYDGIRPYRLEMGYKFPNTPYNDLYSFWGRSIADRLPGKGIIVNVSSLEYTKAVTPFVEASRVITPNFLTIDPKTGTPGFTAVHAKIARGAFARWLITSRVTDPARFSEFSDLGYHFDEAASAPQNPTFICETFDGLGLSIRLS